MTAPSQALEVRPYHDSDESAVLGLLKDALAGGPTGGRTADFFRWKHLENHFGRSFGLVALEGSAVVGIRLFMRWRFRVGSIEVPAVRAVDTATHPEHQGRGIFKRLTLAAVEHVRTEADLVFNTPNASSLPGYLKMGWSSVATIPIHIKPARPIRFARGLPSARTAIAGGASTAAIDLPAALDELRDGAALAAFLHDIFEADRADGRFTTDRTAEYLRWRYAAPGLDYRALAIKQAGELIGLALGRPRRRGTLTEFTLGDVLVRPGDTQTACRLLRGVARSGVDHVAAHLPRESEARAVAIASGYFSAPRAGMVLVANPLNTLPLAPFESSSWKLSLGDLELF